MIAVLDTHVLLWWFAEERRLSRPQRRLLARVDAEHPVGVSDMTAWEIGLLVESGRVQLGLPVDAWLRKALAAPDVVRCAIEPDVVREMVAIETTRAWDPGDRVIVATARVRGVPLVTSDSRIIESGLVKTIE